MRIKARFASLIAESAKQEWKEFYDCMNEDGTIDGEKLDKYTAKRTWEELDAPVSKSQQKRLDVQRTPKKSQKDGLEGAYGSHHEKIKAFTGEY